MAENLTLQIEEIRDSLTRGDFVNEAQISRSVVMRLLNTLGWNVWDPKVVIPEFPIKRRKVDYAFVIRPASRPLGRGQRCRQGKRKRRRAAL